VDKSATGGAPTGDGSGDIKVGVYGDLTGQTSSFGQSTINGIRLAVDEINAAGGVNGRKITLVSEDDQGRPEQATTVVQKLVNQDKVSAILGEVASTNSFSRRAGRAGSEDSDDYAVFDESESDRSRRLHFARLFY
jgi:ABC-type branched-subunit amino acid transport system substrate-binding protein